MTQTSPFISWLVPISKMCPSLIRPVLMRETTCGLSSVRPCGFRSLLLWAFLVCLCYKWVHTISSVTSKHTNTNFPSLTSVSSLYLSWPRMRADVNWLICDLRLLARLLLHHDTRAACSAQRPHYFWCRKHPKFLLICCTLFLDYEQLVNAYRQHFLDFEPHS